MKNGPLQTAILLFEYIQKRTCNNIKFKTVLKQLLERMPVIQSEKNKIKQY